MSYISWNIHQILITQIEWEKKKKKTPTTKPSFTFIGVELFSTDGYFIFILFYFSVKNIAFIPWDKLLLNTNLTT